MFTIDEVNEMLNEIADEVPAVFFEDLNGGIILLNECKAHPQSVGNLYILGEYNRRYDMGRSIHIYYGSFMRVFGYLHREALKQELRHTLFHEFRHHMESLAGQRDLEIWDEEQLIKYKQNQTRRKVGSDYNGIELQEKPGNY